MKLYTSYWARIKEFPTNLVALNTTVWPPRWYQVGGIDKKGIISLHCPPLRPGSTCDGLCKGNCNPRHPQDCAFLREYSKQLDAIDFNDFMRHIQKLHDKLCTDFSATDNDFDFAFIFFEKYDNPCSERWPVKQWFQNHGIQIEEWNPNV
jgi:hypothetical protein